MSDAVEGEHGFWKAWLTHARALFIITGVILLLEQTSCLAPVESLGIDKFVRTFRTPISKEIFLVEITDHDYRYIFNNKSPLDATILDRLLTRIAADGPAVIGVDLDTSDTALPTLAGNKKFIWAEVPATVESGAAEPKRDSLEFSLMPVIASVRDPQRMGMPQFPQDEDGVVRRFEDSYYVLDGHNRLRINALACAVMSATRSDVHCRPPGDDRRFSLSGDRFRFQTVDANEILSRKDDLPLSNSPFADKVVFVGGRYRAGRDSYVTPAGELAGVEVIANAAQSYIPGEGRAIRDAPIAAAGIFDLLTGTFIIWLYFFFSTKPLTAFWMSITAGPIGAMICSFLVFLSLHYWLGFMPVILGIVIHELYDYAERLEELQSGEERKREATFWTFVSYHSQRLLRYPRRDRS